MIKPQQSLRAQNVAAGGASRRAFLGNMGGAAVLGMVTSAVELGPLVEAASGHEGPREERGRAQEAFKIRVRATAEERDVRIPAQMTNGDEERYADFIGSYSKGLPHNPAGEVDRAAYDGLLRAVKEEELEAFEEIQLGGTVKLVNPMAGVAFDLEGVDSHQQMIGPPQGTPSAMLQKLKKLRVARKLRKRRRPASAGRCDCLLRRRENRCERSGTRGFTISMCTVKEEEGKVELFHA